MACLVGLIVTGTQSAVPVEDLVLDPSALRSDRWYAGMLTSLGVLGWSVVVCFCALTSFVAALDERRAAAGVFRWGAIYFAFLLFDDLFLLHSAVLPSMLGLSKSVILLLEAGLGGAWVLAGRRELGRTRWPILSAASVAFAGSLLVDAVAGAMSGQTLLLEDGLKMLGIAALATWAVLTSIDIIRSVVVWRGTGTSKPNDEDGSAGDASRRPHAAQSS